MDRREVFERDATLRLLGRFKVDRVDAQQREVFFAFAGLAHLTGDGIAHLEVVAADDVLAYIDIVGTGEVVVLGVP